MRPPPTRNDQVAADLHRAAIDIGRYLTRHGRISVWDTKEKYGTARVYCTLGWGQLHDIAFPGYTHNRFPRWLWALDCMYLSRVVPVLCNAFVIPWQKRVYRKAYMEAVRLYPHLWWELTCAADYPELLVELPTAPAAQRDAPEWLEEGWP